MQPLAYRVLPEQEECRRSAARAGTANVVVTTEYATEGPDTNQTAPLAVACASRVAVQPYSVRATPGQCGQAMTYSATSDQSWPNNGRKQSQLAINCFPYSYPLYPRKPLESFSDSVNRSINHQHASHRFRYLQDHLRHHPPSSGCLPGARMRCRLAHQHLFDHPGLHSRYHPRFVHHPQVLIDKPVD